jgi:hypothetical protein
LYIFGTPDVHELTVMSTPEVALGSRDVC